MTTIKTKLLTIVVLLCSISARAHDFEVDGIFYNITSATDLTVEVTYRGEKYDSFSNEYTGYVVIPSTVTYKSKVLSVTQIASKTFEDCTDLTGITIPKSVKCIENFAFNGCHGLKDLRFEDGTEVLQLGYNHNAGIYPTIGRGLFYNCFLKTLYLGRNLSYETDLKSGFSPFYEQESLEIVTIGKSVTCIEENAFDGCTGVKRVYINDLSAWCNIDFRSWPGLKKELYLNGKAVTSLVIPDGVTDIKYRAFSGCTGLTSITIPNSVTNIGGGAFSGCTGLTSITIPNSVTNIGGGAFSGCTGLTSITIPNSVTSIGGGAFDECTGLTRVELDCANIDHWFYDPLLASTNSSIKEIVIGENVKSIRDKAFYNGKGLTKIYFLGKVPPSIGEDSFTASQYVNVTLYVPFGTLKTYQTANVWKNFWDIQEEEEIIVIETQPTAENLQVKLNTPEEGVRYQWYQYVEGMIYCKEIVPTSSGYFAWTESNGVWTSGNNKEGSQTFSVMTATVKVQLGDTISFDYTVPKGDGSYSGGSQWFEFTLKGETYMQTFGGKNGHANHFELHIDNYIIDRKLNEDSTMTIGFECVRTNSERATVSNIKHIRPTGFYRGMVDEEIVGATTAKLDESLFNKGNIVYCVVTLPNGTTITSDEVQTTIDGTKIEEVVSDTTNGYIVYNLYGTLVMKTMEKSDLNNLPQGIYIINNKKMFVK